MKYLTILGNILGYIALITFFVFLIVGIPMGIIWGINYLFGFDIEYSWKSWLAVVLISSVFGGASR
jgi:hypothetical protein